MDLSNIYLVRNNSKVFKTNTLVKYITCTYSGNCHLVADLNDDLKREWLMYYDLYPVNMKKEDYRYNYYYNLELDNIAKEQLRLAGY